MGEKRSRGRPVGSGRKDDSKYLQQVADILAANPEISRRSAMCQVVHKHFSTPEEQSESAMLRRLQRGWDVESVSYMEAARARMNRAANDRLGERVLLLATQYDAMMKRIAGSEELQRALQASQKMAEDAVRAFSGPIAQLQSFLDNNPELLKILLNASNNANRFSRLSGPLRSGPSRQV